MSLGKEISSAFSVLWETVRSAFVSINGNDDKSTRNTILIILLAGAVFGGYKGYKWHIANREANAQRAFADATQLYQSAASDPAKWSDVVGAFSLGYEQNSSSNLAPFFLFFQAQALVEQDKHVDAIDLMESALKKLSSSNSLYNFYQSKLALIKIDSTQDNIRSAGLKSLEVLADDKSNKARDMALFYLGSYFWDKDEMSKAREAWQTLVDLPKGRVRSPYVQLIQDKLEQIG